MQMYRFVVHGFHRGKTHGSPWTVCEYTFGHKDMFICQSWVERLIASTNNDAVRPKSLLVLSVLNYLLAIFSSNFCDILFINFL